MFNSLRKSLPTLDYVSIVRSVYEDRRAMIFGAVTGAVGASVAGLKTGDTLLMLHALAFLLVMLARDRDMRAFNALDHETMSADEAEGWERRATILGGMVAFVYGSWCFCTMLFVRDPFAELVCLSVTVGGMIGIVARNFGLDRLITVQSLMLGVPMGAGLILRGDIFHLVLALLIIPMLVSYRFLAAEIRKMLLSAVHQRLAASRLADQLDTALATMQHGLCMLDENGVIAVANTRARQTFSGLTEGAWTGQTFAELMAQAVARKAIAKASADRLLLMLETGSSGKVLLKLPSDYFCEVSVSTQGDRTVLLFENVTERIRAQERISEMARNDSLTGLANRAHFTEEVEADLARRRRHGVAAEAVLMIIDLDDFKHVNDTKGHLAGDRVLAEVSRRIGDVMHRASLLGRFGGDEFVVFRAGQIGERDVAAEASSIMHAFDQPLIIDGERIDIGLSIGVSVLPAAETDLDTLIARADLALYSAKARGKGQWERFVEQMDTDFRYRQRLKADLRQAIAEESLRLVYQPQVNVRTRRVEICEALARWDHPELGSIPPAVFIGLAEEMGAICDITRWALATATREATHWPDDVGVSVNISARDVRSAGFADHVERALARSGLAPERLEVEVTETLLIEDHELAAERLSALAARGIGIALDDFGTGYSSLSYLNAMPFTKLKIDRAFSAGVDRDPRTLRLMANVAQLGKDLDLIVIAEGVETEAQLETLRDATGIDQVQGFLFGVPLPASEIRDLIHTLAGSARRSKAANA